MYRGPIRALLGQLCDQQLLRITVVWRGRGAPPHLPQSQRKRKRESRGSARLTGLDLHGVRGGGTYPRLILELFLRLAGVEVLIGCAVS